MKQTKTRLVIQKEISERYGEKALLEAKKRLCNKCAVKNCILLPLTTRGEDCPYFKPKEE